MDDLKKHIQFKHESAFVIIVYLAKTERHLQTHIRAKHEGGEVGKSS